MFLDGSAISPNLNFVFPVLSRELLFQVGINTLHIILPEGKVCCIIVAENAHSLLGNTDRICPGIPNQ